MKTITIRVIPGEGRPAIGDVQPGNTIRVKLKKDGKTPDSRFWRNRLDDEKKYKIGAIEIVKEEKRSSKQAAKSEGDK